MLCYRGDKFVKGKKFTINETEYKFLKKSKDDKLVFESTVDNSILQLTEAEYNTKLEEKINQDNLAMNQLIAKILRSKSEARKHEDELAKYGIKVDYDQGQGVTLHGPNGKSLYSSTKEVNGPAKPGHNDTHRQADNWHSSRVKSYQGYVDEYEKELADLKAMDRDDIIRKYNDKTTEEALKAHEDAIKRTEERIESYKKDVESHKQSSKREEDSTLRTRRAGHKGLVNWHDTNMPKSTSNEKVDYLNYLTKVDYNNPTKTRGAGAYVGDSKQSTDKKDSWYDTHYYGKHGKPEEKSEKMKKYQEYKDSISRAKDDVRRSSQGSGSYASYKSEEELEAEIQKMRDELEARIEKLKSDNDYRKAGNAKDIEKLQAREKELDDYLKSLGIRESVRTKMVEKAMLAESVRLNEGHEEHYEYVKKTVDDLFEEILNIGIEMEGLGYTALSRKLSQCLSIIEDYSFAADSIYTKEDGTAGRIMTAQEAKDSGIYDAIEKLKK